MARGRSRCKDGLAVYKSFSDTDKAWYKEKHAPLLKLSALTTPPSIKIRIRRSSDRTSYIEISPEAKPIPTTSIAGDCVKAVIALGVFCGEELRRNAENLCMQVLREIVGE